MQGKYGLLSLTYVISFFSCTGLNFKYCKHRGTETEEQILKRLRNAKAEIEQGKSSDIFDHILYNDKLEECYESLKVICCCFTHIFVNPFIFPLAFIS